MDKARITSSRSSSGPGADKILINSSSRSEFKLGSDKAPIVVSKARSTATTCVVTAGPSKVDPETSAGSIAGPSVDPKTSAGSIAGPSVVDPETSAGSIAGPSDPETS